MTQAELLNKHADKVAAYKKFLESDMSSFEEVHFESMALGFFIALGVTEPMSGDEFGEAFALAYWVE